MLQRLYKKALPFCLAIMLAIFAFSSNVPVYGASDGNSIHEEVVEVSDTSTVLTRGNFLNYGTVAMSKVSSTRVLISGITVAHKVCDKLGVSLYLERSSDGVNYTSYRHWDFWGENKDMFSQTLELIVLPGYWYRLGGGHIAIMGNDGESTTTITKGLYVN